MLVQKTKLEIGDTLIGLSFLQSYFFSNDLKAPIDFIHYPYSIYALSMAYPCFIHLVAIYEKPITLINSKD
jgi:hypothetical protein